MSFTNPPGLIFGEGLRAGEPTPLLLARLGDRRARAWIFATRLLPDILLPRGSPVALDVALVRDRHVVLLDEGEPAPLIPAQPRALLDCLQPVAEVCPLPPLEGETTEILGEAAPTPEHRGRRARGKSRPRTAGATEEARRANASLARPQRTKRALVAAAKA